MKKIEKTIDIKITDHPDELITKVKQAVEKNGLRFKGDTEKGLIKGFGIHINYLLKEDILTIKFLRKPLLLSWSQVELKVRELVSISQNTG